MDDDLDFKNLIKYNLEREANRKAKYKSDSRDRLGKICTKKITTTMVGALDSIERHFGFLWNNNNDDVLSDEAKHMKQLYEKVREEILDNGNNQIRNLLLELEQYEVEWMRYTLKLSVKPHSGQ